MTAVDLFTFKNLPAGRLWPLGEVFEVPANPAGLADFTAHWVRETTAEFVLLWDTRLGPPDPDVICGLAVQPTDVHHAGLCLGMNRQPRVMDFAYPTWMFNRNAPPDIGSSSWRVSVHACLVRTEVLRKLSFIHPGFRTLEAAALDWGLRCMRNGVFMRHHPELLPEGHQAPEVELPLEDELRFARLQFGRKWQAWMLTRLVLTRYTSPHRVWRAWKESADTLPARAEPDFRSVQQVHLSSAVPPNVREQVSILLPTLDRYPYLHNLLGQLRVQTVPPQEIIIIDQSKPEVLPAGFYEEFSDLPLKIIHQENAGQCSSRNAGLQLAGGEYILFLDDDDEVPPNLIEAHLVSLNCYKADAIAGAAEVPEEGELPDAFRLVRVSDVFPTNNTMLRRESLQKTGLFDLAYDHGSRADGDLGMRMYLTGARVILDPGVKVLHHHAPRGGLRAHKARIITYSSSRRSLLQRNLPSVTEIYLMMRYFSAAQVHEGLLISLLGTFGLHHASITRRLLKALISALLLPHSIWTIEKRRRQAQDMFLRFPQIPSLSDTHA